jgi:hypothetical protein
MLCILYVQTSNNYPKKIKKNNEVQCINTNKKIK